MINVPQRRGDSSCFVESICKTLHQYGRTCHTTLVKRHSLYVRSMEKGHLIKPEHCLPSYKINSVTHFLVRERPTVFCLADLFVRDLNSATLAVCREFWNYFHNSGLPNESFRGFLKVWEMCTHLGDLFSFWDIDSSPDLGTFDWIWPKFGTTLLNCSIIHWMEFAGGSGRIFHDLVRRTRGKVTGNENLSRSHINGDAWLSFVVNIELFIIFLERNLGISRTICFLSCGNNIIPSFSPHIEFIIIEYLRRRYLERMEAETLA